MRIWALSGECLRVMNGHSSFIYSVSVLNTGEIISGGEDRTVKVWNTKGECLQTIAMPCNSIWVVKALKNGDFAVGGSDAVVRVFSRDKNRIASAAVLKHFEETVAESAITMYS
jgi:phospholipase A-2-activating protein